MTVKVQRAGREYAGLFCTECQEEITEHDVIIISQDGDVDSEGMTFGTQTAKHSECPDEDDAA